MFSLQTLTIGSFLILSTLWQKALTSPVPSDTSNSDLANSGKLVSFELFKTVDKETGTVTTKQFSHPIPHVPKFNSTDSIAIPQLHCYETKLPLKADKVLSYQEKCCRALHGRVLDPFTEMSARISISNSNLRAICVFRTYEWSYDLWDQGDCMSKLYPIYKDCERGAKGGEYVWENTPGDLYVSFGASEK